MIAKINPFVVQEYSPETWSEDTSTSETVRVPARTSMKVYQRTLKVDLEVPMYDEDVSCPECANCGLKKDSWVAASVLLMTNCKTDNPEPKKRETFCPMQAVQHAVLAQNNTMTV